MSENLYFDKSDRALLDIVNSTTEQKTDVKLEQKLPTFSVKTPLIRL